MASFKDYTLDGLLNLCHSGADLADAILAWEHAQSAERFNYAANLLSLAEPNDRAAPSKRKPG